MFSNLNWESRKNTYLNRSPLVLKILTVLVLWVGLTSYPIYCQSIEPERVLNAMQHWMDIATPEKVYIMTDKDLYVAGETIWMSAWVVNGITHEPGTNSGIVYIDIIDSWGKSWLSNMFQLTVGRAAGQFEIPMDLPQGNYQIRAYTYRMRLYDEGYQFKRSLTIINKDADQVGPTYQLDGNTLTVAFSIGSDSEKDQENIPVTLKMLNEGNEVLIDDTIFRTNKEGEILGTLAVNQALWDNGEPRIVISWEADGQKIQLSYRVPHLGDQLIIRFFPESGELVVGLDMRIAVQAHLPNGSPVEVTGRLMDASGNEIAPFSTTYGGIGLLEFKPEAGNRYRLELDLPSEKSMVADLPEPIRSGVNLRADASAKGVNLKLISTSDRNDILLVAHQRGNIIWAARSAEMRADLVGFIPADRLLSGVLHITAFDSTGRPLAERLIFNRNNDDELSVDATMNGNVYRPRSQVTIPLAFSSPAGPGLPSIAVSVTEEQGLLDKQIDLKSWLLLGSDLHGQVHDLSSFINGAGRDHADLLMMTHGWNRFRWTDLLNNTVEALPPMYEGFDVRGRIIQSRNREGISNSKVAVMHQNVQGGVGDAVTDERGYFTVHNMSFPDSTQLVVHGDDKGGKVDIRIELDDIIKPQGGRYFLPYPSNNSGGDDVFSNYATSVRERLTIDRSWGVEMQAYSLDEVLVSASRIRERVLPTRLLIEPDRVIDIQSQAHVYGKALDYLAKNSRGFSMTNVSGKWEILDKSNVTLTRNERCTEFGCQPLLLIDGIEATLTDVNYLNATDVEVIEILNGPNAAAYGANAIGGVISIVTRSGQPVDRNNMSSISVDGYTNPREFYAPDYGIAADINRKPDYRSTLYWLPYKAANEQGLLNLQFWTGDKTGRWTVRIEGLDEIGRTVTYKTFIDVVGAQ